ncbi:phospholipase effector Tle1 domain-containing protein [Parasphingorhabdus sp. NYA22]|jgi:hypothetical protein|nr:MAG: hypothetical protein COA41_11980 [Sphingopyxis sp.]|tara:strand:+ start:866 stop:2356 length:1491 start_codon:yes stop_codon:yes gene_type:complete
MSKNILIYSDGTGQVGGLRPDQRLSNVYKLYRATRPGPDSTISPKKQVTFYDAGLGAGEAGGLTFKRLRNFFAAALGTGIDENVIDCYAAIIAHHRPGDKVVLIGFSRGAYTVRAVTNVMNLCGVPKHDGEGNPVPRYGPALRMIASEAVRDVYNHGAGSKRGKYERQREHKARRFRSKYGSEGVGADGEGQGNVQPEFVGVFDTVAALGSRTASIVVAIAFLVTAFGFWRSLDADTWWLSALAGTIPAFILYWVLRSVGSQFKYYFEDDARSFRWWNPVDWISALWHGHMAWWSGKNYDRYVDREIPKLRHALSIDEARKKFPRVGWGSDTDVQWNKRRGNPNWLEQLWFVGNHSDIGGSYPEDESRLSDIALEWMAGELVSAVPTIEIQRNFLNTAPDPFGLQHDEIQSALDMQPKWVRWISRDKLTWGKRVRSIHPEAKLHQSVADRLSATAVPQMGDVKPYLPTNLKGHICQNNPQSQSDNISRSIWPEKDV